MHANNTAKMRPLFIIMIILIVHGFGSVVFLRSCCEFPLLLATAYWYCYIVRRGFYQSSCPRAATRVLSCRSVKANAFRTYFFALGLAFRMIAAGHLLEGIRFW